MSPRGCARPEGLAGILVVVVERSLHILLGEKKVNEVCIRACRYSMYDSSAASTVLRDDFKLLRICKEFIGGGAC